MPINLETLILDNQDGILTIKLNRPKQLNAISKLMIQEMGQVLAEADNEKNTRVIMITGNERVFSAGIDINEINFANPFDAYQGSRQFQQLMVQIENLSKPVIAAVQGMALGGGFELMLSCDLRVVGETAQVGTPEVGLGTLAAGGGTARLPRALPYCKAIEMLLLGEPVTGAEAQARGLINYAVANDQVLTTATALAQKIAAKSPLVVARIKEIARSSGALNLDATLRIEAQSLALLTTSQDYQEGTSAFFAKRKPVFTGK